MLIVIIQISACFDSINKPEDLILTAAEIGLKGIALTDHEILSGHVEWLQQEKSLKEKGIIPKDFKCMLGNEIYLTNDRRKSQKYFHFILIAKDTEGHKQLRELSSKAWYNSYYDRGMERVPTLKSELKEIIEKNKGHIIATSSCLGGELPNLVLALTKAESARNKDNDKIDSIKEEIVNFLKYCISLFGEDFYIEIAPKADSKEQIIFNNRVKNIAKAFKIKMILATDAHYLTAKDRPMHKAYLNSKDGEREIDGFYGATYLMSNQEAFDNLYPYYNEEEFSELCNNTMEIFDKVEKYDIFHNPIIPMVDVKDYPISFLSGIVIVGEKNPYPVISSLLMSDNIQERYWINQCIENLFKKCPWENTKDDLEEATKEDSLIVLNRTKEDYLHRIEVEADIIKTISEKLGNCLFAYFNTFQHYIDLFWECGSLSGPGRGSSVCFLSNYLLGITQLDPIKWGLMEWRFLNKERVELP